MRFKRALAALLVALLATAGTQAVTAAPAGAHVANGCQDGWFCTYWDYDFGGAMYAYSSPQWSCVNIGGGWDNQISGIHNNRPFYVSLWSEPGCTGAQLTEDPPNSWFAHSDGNLFGYPDYFNDIASSISFGW